MFTELVTTGSTTELTVTFTVPPNFVHFAVTTPFASTVAPSRLGASTELTVAVGAPAERRAASSERAYVKLSTGERGELCRA